jgi:ABC-type sugar transport system ATPase subunit
MKLLVIADHPLLDRITRLSGGEMQRVAIGRAIVREPRLFLMDEPLSNLDAKLRESLRVELQHLQKTQGNTTLFVTHDQIEALTMADRIAILNQGRVIQVGTPSEIYDRPATTFVATLVGTPRINLFRAKREDGSVLIENSELHLPSIGALPAQFFLGIRPEDIRLTPDGKFSGRLVLTELWGNHSAHPVQWQAMVGSIAVLDSTTRSALTLHKTVCTILIWKETIMSLTANSLINTGIFISPLV